MVTVLGVVFTTPRVVVSGEVVGVMAASFIGLQRPLDRRRDRTDR
jgi:hypothetical protein